MSKNSRREFLIKVGLTAGAMAVGKDILEASPLGNIFIGTPQRGTIKQEPMPTVDFRYAPKTWQSTYCFPDDPYKSIVGKYGELLYGHAGAGADEKIFTHVVSVALKGKESLTYIEQKLESPSIPIITTKLDGGGVIVQLISFASNDSGEGRVDNLMIEIIPKNSQPVECTPEIIIKSSSKFTHKSEDKFSTLYFDIIDGKLFMAADTTAEYQIVDGVHHYQLKSGTAKSDKPLKYFVRFPQENQDYKKVKDGLEEPDSLMKDVKNFWDKWKPTYGKVEWNLQPEFQNFVVASARNILEAREIKDNKKIFQVGPTCYRGLWVVDGHFLLEAARYLGYDKEAQEGLESIWARQNDKGLITGGAGESHWKDTAVAVYGLIRQAELSQNWDYFLEKYPDAHKALMALKDLQEKAVNDGSSNGKYKLLPKGFGDSGIGGIREEYTNTLWALIALKAMDDVAKRFSLNRRVDIRDFYGTLRQNFFSSIQEELREHPNGFTYLPMLMKNDPKWSEKDERKQPRPQAAQIYLSQAIYPGFVFVKQSNVINGHLQLMKSITKEDIPSETGWLTDNAVWTYNAAILAQVYLWIGQKDLARKTFFGFLNHASPLYAWREEQSLQSASVYDFIGDMPHNWASAECIRYLRHMIILEDERNIRLFDGIGLPELNAGKTIALTYSPTRWGRVTATLEPVDKKTWITKFKREDFNDKKYSQIDHIIVPRKLAGVFYFNGIKGVKSGIEGNDVLIKAENTSWECEWKSL